MKRRVIAKRGTIVNKKKLKRRERKFVGELGLYEIEKTLQALFENAPICSTDLARIVGRGSSSISSELYILWKRIPRVIVREKRGSKYVYSVNLKFTGTFDKALVKLRKRRVGSPPFTPGNSWVKPGFGNGRTWKTSPDGPTTGVPEALFDENLDLAPGLKKTIRPVSSPDKNGFFGEVVGFAKKIGMETHVVVSSSGKIKTITLQKEEQ